MSTIQLTEAERTVLADVLARSLDAYTYAELRHQFDDWTEVDFAALDSARDKIQGADLGAE